MWKNTNMNIKRNMDYVTITAMNLGEKAHSRAYHLPSKSHFPRRKVPK
jgi:hypothetical protein